MSSLQNEYLKTNWFRHQLYKYSSYKSTFKGRQKIVRSLQFVKIVPSLKITTFSTKVRPKIELVRERTCTTYEIFQKYEDVLGGLVVPLN